MGDSEVCQLDLIKISPLIKEGELEGDSPPTLLVKLQNQTLAEGAAGRAVNKKVVRLLSGENYCSVILNMLRSTNTMNDLGTSVPTVVCATNSSQAWCLL